jgi:hypothetical protein
MSETITIKIHNILHNKQDYNKTQVEKYIEEQTDEKIKEVRIAKGNSNSPLFLEIPHTINDFKTIKQLSRQATQLFSDKVDGINIQKTIKDNNLQINHP